MHRRCALVVFVFVLSDQVCWLVFRWASWPSGDGDYRGLFVVVFGVVDGCLKWMGQMILRWMLVVLVVLVSGVHC